MNTEWMNDYVGIPFAENGRTRDGFDCYGVVMDIYQTHLGVKLPQWADWDGSHLAAVAVLGSATNMKQAVPLDGPEDWAIFTQERSAGPHHMGVCFGDYALHAVKNHGVIIEPISRLNSVRFWKWRT